MPEDELKVVEDQRPLTPNSAMRCRVAGVRGDRATRYAPLFFFPETIQTPSTPIATKNPDSRHMGETSAS